MAWSQRSHSTYLHNTLVNSSDLDQTVTHSLGFQEWLTTVTIDVHAGCGLGVDMARQDFSKVKKKKEKTIKTNASAYRVHTEAFKTLPPVLNTVNSTLGPIAQLNCTVEIDPIHRHGFLVF